jgi:hypothetical protein
VAVCKSFCSSTHQPSHAHHQLHQLQLRHRQTASTPTAQHSTAQQATGGSSRAVRTLVLTLSAELDHRLTTKRQQTNSTTSHQHCPDAARQHGLDNTNSTTPTRQHRLENTDSKTLTRRHRQNSTIASEYNQNLPSTIDDVPRHCL